MANTSLYINSSPAKVVFIPKALTRGQKAAIATLLGTGAIALLAATFAVLSAHGVSLGPLNALHHIPAGGRMGIEASSLAVFVADIAVVSIALKKQRDFGGIRQYLDANKKVLESNSKEIFNLLTDRRCRFESRGTYMIAQTKAKTAYFVFMINDSVKRVEIHREEPSKPYKGKLFRDGFAQINLYSSEMKELFSL